MLRYFVLIIVLLPASALANDGPISSWDFDGDLTDTRGRAKDDFSAASGQVRFVNADDLPGVEGQAVAIGVESGDAPYFTAPSSVDTQLGPAYTIEAWIHPTQISDSWNRLVLGWGHERAYHFAVRDGAIDLHHAQADRVERSCSGGCIKPHYWYHVAAIAARNEADPEASKLAVYVNGEKVASTTFDGTIHVRENGPIGLGDSADAPSGTIGFKGYVDSVTVFNRPLTDAEIHQRCERRRDILGQSSWGLALKKRWKTESRLAVAIELEKLAREQDMGDDMMDVAAEMLDDRDPFVRAMAEWAIARKVARDNNHEQVTWTADSESPWLKKYLAIPTAERVEMDWCRQAVALGMHNDAKKLVASIDEMITRTESMGDEQAVRSARKALQSIRAEMEIAGTIDRLRSLWLDARRAMRPAVFESADLGFDEIILFSRYCMHYKPNVCGVHTSWSYKPGGDIVIVSGLENHRDARSLIRGKLGPGHVHGIDLSFDADKVVFAWANQPEWPPRFSTHWPRGGNDCYAFELRNTTIPPHLYEMDLATGAIEQLTDHNFWTDVEPTYCPDGTIAFTSDRSAHSPSCDGAMNDLTDHNLYSLSADRQRIRRLTNQKDIDMHPHLLENGLIAYLRWEYQERHFWDVHSVWTVKPDGTMSDALYKQHLSMPLSVRDARGIPGTNKLVAIAAGHHALPKGPVVVIDPSAGINDPRGIRMLTPGSVPQETARFKWPGPAADYDYASEWKDRLVDGGGVRVAGGFFMMPYAVSEKAFLVSYAYGNREARRYHGQHSDVDSNGLGVYLIDTRGNMELIHREPLHSCYGVLPFAQRTCPAVLPDMVDMTSNFATCVVPDVYEGMEDVPRGTVKYIRIAEALPWPIVPGEGVKRWDLSNRWCPVRVIGTVPVEADGSAHFKVPVADNASVYFQTLDERHMEVRRMRSSISFQPGERRACNGCHETRASGPALKQGIAAGRAPDAPTPPSWGVGQISLRETVQPVLDRHCVGCHGSADPAGGRDFTAGRAYQTIVGGGLVSLSPREGDGSITMPYQYGSHKSRLITKLLDDDTPCQVKLDEDEWIRLVTWVDANAPNAAGMHEKRTADGLNWVWSEYPWKDPWADPIEVPARGDYLKLPDNKWRRVLGLDPDKHDLP